MPRKSTTPSFSEKDIPNLKGYVIIVTGGNSGIGYEASFQLAQRGARVYIGGRSTERVEDAIDRMNQAHGAKLDIRFLRLDLTDLKSVKSAAQQFATLERRLDVLINNAGIMSAPYKLTGDGFESQWQTNYLAPHALTHCLMPLLLSTASSSPDGTRVRVVNVSSDAAFSGPKTIEWNDVNMTSTKGVMELWKRYGHSKQASIRDAKYINDLYSTQGVTAYSVHPGYVPSNLQSHDPTIIGSAIRLAMKLSRTTALQGALTTLYCATSPEAPAVGAGRFFVPVGKLDARADTWFADTEGNKRLWEMAEEQFNTGLS